MKALIPR